MNPLRIVVLTLLLTVFTSCGDTTKPPPSHSYQHMGEGAWGGVTWAVDSIRVDGCEYLIIFGSESRMMLHKENCDNQFHREGN